jgi:outer membrane protein OmpA-like peptidoglycan-associated protein
MRHGFIDVVVLAVVATGTALGADVGGSKDHPLVSRYPGSTITGYRTAEFDEFTLPLGKVKPDSTFEKAQHLEGKVTAIHYQTPAERSILEVYRNYETALKAAGFQTLFACAHNAECGRGDPTLWRPMGDTSWESDQQRYLSAKLSRPEGDVYLSLHISSYGSVYAEVYVVEVKPMESGLVKVNAAAMASSIANTGSVAIYGINFDTAKSDIKPDSEPAIDEIVKLLTNNPALKVGIVGHTDMVGDATSNMRLSQARAQSVITDLVSKHGIAAARLVAFGAGPWAPLASNKTDDGRARNRRVELVEIATK